MLLQEPGPVRGRPRVTRKNLDAAALGALSDAIHGTVDRTTRSRVHALFADARFAPRPHLDADARCAAAYEQLRTLNGELGPGTELLADPARLFAAFGWAGTCGLTLTFAMLVHYCLAQATLVDLGNPAPWLDEYAAALNEAAVFGSFMITELGRGSSHVATRTEARYDPARDEFVLHTPSPAAAKLMPNVGLPGVPKLGVVCARLNVAGRDRGVFPFAVPIRDHRGLRPGIRVRRVSDAALFALDSCVVAFDHVRVPRAAWLAGDASIDADGRYNEEIAGVDARLVRTLAGGSLVWPAQAAALAGASRACVAIALRHSFHRITMARFAPRLPAIAHRGQRRLLLGALAEAYAVTWLANAVCARRSEQAHRTAGTADGGNVTLGGSATPWSSVDRMSPLVKALAATSLERIATRCRRASGALGVLAVNRITEYQGLGHAFHSAGGDGQLILLDTARTLVASPAPPPAEADSGLDQGEVLDRRFLTGLARARERLAHQQLNEQWEKARQRGDVFAAWDAQFDAAMALSEAHGASLFLRTGLAAAEAVANPTAARLLEELSTLHALEEVHAHSGWLLANKLLTPSQASDIPRALDALCDGLAPYALDLIEAFAIPDTLLSAPIARTDYAELLAPGPAAS